MSLSGRNPISGTYIHFFKWGKSQQRRNLVVASEWGISHLQGMWMDVLLDESTAITDISPSGGNPSNREILLPPPSEGYPVF